MPTAAQIVCPHCATPNRIRAEHPDGVPKCGSCHQALFTAHALDVDEAAFERHLRLSSIPVLADIWAPWFGPCRAMSPAFERAAAVLEPGMRLLKLNADTAPNTCSRLGVRGIPAMFVFHNGTVIGQTAGAMDTGAIVRWARDQIPADAH